MKVRLFGSNNSDTWITTSALGVVHAMGGDLASAEPLFLEAYEGQASMLGEDHPRTLGTRNNIVQLLERSGRLEEAASHMTEMVDLIRARFPRGGPDHLWSVQRLIGIYETMGRMADARDLAREILDCTDPGDPEFAPLEAEWQRLRRLAEE